MIGWGARRAKSTRRPSRARSMRRARGVRSTRRVESLIMFSVMCKKSSVLLFLGLRVYWHVHHCADACFFPREVCMHESFLIVVTIFSLFFSSNGKVQYYCYILTRGSRRP